MSINQTFRKHQEEIYLDRKKNLQLCSTNASSTSSMVFGFFVLLFSGFGYIVYLLANPVIGILLSPAANFILAILTIGYYTFKKGWKGNTVPDTPSLYNPHKIFRSNVYDFINAIIFVISFFGFFLYLEVPMISFFIGLMMLIVMANMIYTFNDDQKKYLSNKIFGISRIEIQSPIAQIGNRLSIRFYNEKLFEQVSEVNVVLRNLHEHWRMVKGKKNKNKTEEIVTTIFFEEKHIVHLVDDTFNLDFDLPNDKVHSSNYSLNNPTYWELEVSDKESGFYSRFFIEVLSNDEVIFEKELELKLAEKVISS